MNITLFKYIVRLWLYFQFTSNIRFNYGWTRSYNTKVLPHEL